MIAEISELQKVWLACAIDTEGYIGLSPHHKGYRVLIQVTNTNVQFMDRLWKITEVGKLYTRLPRKQERKVIYVWQVYKLDDCLQILKLIQPYLIIKREKAANMLLYLKYRKQKGRGKSFGIVERTLVEGKETEIKDIQELL